MNLKEKVGPFPAYVYPLAAGGLILTVVIWRRSKGNASTQSNAGTVASGDSTGAASPYNAGDYYWPSTYYVPPGTATGATPTPVGTTPPVLRGGSTGGIGSLGGLLHASRPVLSVGAAPITGHLPVDRLPVMRPQGLAPSMVGTVPSAGVAPSVSISTLQAQARKAAA